MPVCIKIRKKKRELCIGDMRDEIILQDRSITPPDFGATDFTENFISTPPSWALVNTVSGKTYFDDINTEIDITHEIYIRFDATVTAETWILFDGRRIDILTTEDLDERHIFMKLTCNDTGESARAASEA